MGAIFEFIQILHITYKASVGCFCQAGEGEGKHSIAPSKQLKSASPYTPGMSSLPKGFDTQDHTFQKTKNGCREYKCCTMRAGVSIKYLQIESSEDDAARAPSPGRGDGGLFSAPPQSLGANDTRNLPLTTKSWTRPFDRLH